MLLEKVSGFILHPNSVVGGTCVTSFIQGGKRAPRLISSLEDGPSIGFITGYIFELFRSVHEELKQRTLKESGDPCALALATSSYIMIASMTVVNVHTRDLISRMNTDIVCLTYQQMDVSVCLYPASCFVSAVLTEPWQNGEAQQFLKGVRHLEAL